MTLEDFAKISPVVTFLVGVIGVVITIAAVFLRVGRMSQQIEDHIAKLEDRIARAEAKLEDRISGVESSLTRRLDMITNRLDVLYFGAEGFSREINALFGIMVQLQSNRQQLSTEEVALVTKGIAALNDPAVATLFQRERLSRNPLTPEELSRLEGYYRRLQTGSLLTWEEVQESNELVAVLHKERPTDSGVWPLLALGAFLHGLMLGRSESR